MIEQKHKKLNKGKYKIVVGRCICGCNQAWINIKNGKEIENRCIEVGKIRDVLCRYAEKEYELKVYGIDLWRV